ncbi:MAG: GLPGLI family protein [Sphingobacterium sp.]|jgi:GLPGLI family protein|nr:GLPGLI family protein [Sphingobacterium sp.]
MKRNIFILILLLISLHNLIANENKESDMIQAFYKLEFTLDSLQTNKTTVLTELLVYENESWFRSISRGIFDTVQYYGKQATRVYDPQQGQRMNYLINKNYISGDIRYYSPLKAIWQDYCYYDENEKALDWHLTSDTVIRNGISLQKATLDFGNRKWIAYFNPEIPINDGPYKFCGLPGLIFEIKDETETWKFTLLKLVRAKHGPFDHKFLCQAKQMDKVSFHKLERKLFDNNVQEMESRGEIRFKSAADRQRAIDRRKEKSKHYNNPIELLRW